VSGGAFGAARHEALFIAATVQKYMLKALHKKQETFSDGCYK